MKKGFTIVEFAIVLVLVGIIVKIGLNAILGSLSGTRYFEEEREVVDTLKSSVVRYITSSEGLQLPDNATFDNISSAYVDNLTATNDDGYTNFAVDYFHSATSTDVCNYTTAGSDIVVYSDLEKTTETNRIEDVSFAIFTPGMDGRLDTTVIGDNLTIVGNNQSDDLIEYMTMSEVRELVGCPTLEIVTEYIPAFTSRSADPVSFRIDAESASDSSTDKLKWCATSLDHIALGGTNGLYLVGKTPDGTTTQMFINDCTWGTTSLDIDNNLELSNWKPFGGGGYSSVNVDPGAYRILIKVENKYGMTAEREFVLQMLPN